MSRSGRARRQQARPLTTTQLAQEPIGGLPPRVALGTAIVASLIAFAAYCLTLAPSLPSGDSGEFITAAAVLGVAHPPGYPLFAMLGHIFLFLPFDSPAMKVNLMSAVAQAATAGVLALIVLELTPFARPRIAVAAALAGALGLAFATGVWRYAVVAEVFALNNLLSSLFLLLMLVWYRRPQRLAMLWAAAFVLGLALTNHQTAIFLTPAALWLFWRGGSKLAAADPSEHPGGVTPKEFGIAVASGFVGLLPYAYLPLAAARNPPLNWNNPQTLDKFIWEVTRADYGAGNFAGPRFAQGGVVDNLAVYAGNLLQAFGPVACVLVLAGGWWLWQRTRDHALFLLLAFALTGPLFLMYARSPLDLPLWHGITERFYLLSMIPFAAAVGVGAAAAIELLSRRPAILGTAAMALVVATPFAMAALHYGEVDQHQNFVPAHYGEDILSTVPKNALLLTNGDDVTFLIDYLLLVERQRPDVVAFDMEKITFDWYVAQQRLLHPDVTIPFSAYDRGRTNSMKDLIDANLPARPVMVTTEPPSEPGILAQYTLFDAGFVTRLYPAGTPIDDQSPARRQFEISKSMRYPDRSYPVTTWEHRMQLAYAGLATKTGILQEKDGRPAEAEQLYRKAIELAPDLATAYKNLGVVLWTRNPNDNEVPALWERYLQLSPRDAEAAAMRGEITRIRAGR